MSETCACAQRRRELAASCACAALVGLAAGLLAAPADHDPRQCAEEVLRATWRDAMVDWSPDAVRTRVKLITDERSFLRGPAVAAETALHNIAVSAPDVVLSALDEAGPQADPRVRATIVGLCGCAPDDPRSQKVLLRALEDCDWAVRERAAWHIDRLPDPHALARRALVEASTPVKIAAISRLAHRPGSPFTVAESAGMLLPVAESDRSSHVRQAALDALTVHRGVVDRVKGIALADPDSYVGAKAILALWRSTDLRTWENELARTAGELRAEAIACLEVLSGEESLRPALRAFAAGLAERARRTPLTAPRDPRTVDRRRVGPAAVPAEP